MDPRPPLLGNCTTLAQVHVEVWPHVDGGAEQRTGTSQTDSFCFFSDAAISLVNSDSHRAADVGLDRRTERELACIDCPIAIVMPATGPPSHRAQVRVAGIVYPHVAARLPCRLTHAPAMPT